MTEGKCPNKASKEWKTLVSQVGDDLAWATWMFYGEDFPNIKSITDLRTELSMPRQMSGLQLGLFGKRLKDYNAYNGTSHSFTPSRVGQADLYNVAFHVNYLPVSKEIERQETYKETPGMYFVDLKSPTTFGIEENLGTDYWMGDTALKEQEEKDRHFLRRLESALEATQRQFAKDLRAYKYSNNIPLDVQMNVSAHLAGVALDILKTQLIGNKKGVKIFTHEVDKVKRLTKEITNPVALKKAIDALPKYLFVRDMFRERAKEMVKLIRDDNTAADVKAEAQAQLDLIQHILTDDNGQVWKLFEQSAIRKLNARGYKLVKKGDDVEFVAREDGMSPDENEVSADDVVDDDVYGIKLDETGKTDILKDSLSISNKETMSTRLRTFLSSIRSTQLAPIPLKGQSGTTFDVQYVNEDIVIQAINEATLGETTLEGMLAALRAVGTAIPERYYLIEVADKLGGAGDEIKNQFVSKFNQQQSNFIVHRFDKTPRVLRRYQTADGDVRKLHAYTVDENGKKSLVYEYDSKIFNANRNELATNLKEKAKEDFFSHYGLDGNTIPAEIGAPIYNRYISFMNSAKQYIKSDGTPVGETEAEKTANIETLRNNLKNLLSIVQLDIDDRAINKLISGSLPGREAVIYNFNPDAKDPKSMFYNKKGILGTIFNRFAEGSTPTIDDVLGSSGAWAILNLEANYQQSFYNTSVLNGKGQKVWGYSAPNPLSTEFYKITNELESGNTVYLNKVLQDPYRSKSFLISYFTELTSEERRQFLENFQYGIVNTLKSGTRDGKDLNDTERREFILTQLVALSSNAVKDGSGNTWSYKFLTTPSDKSVMYQLQTPDFKIEYKQGQPVIGDATVNRFFKYFEGEYGRSMTYQNASPEQKATLDSIDTYEPMLFYHFPSLNLKEGNPLWTNGKLNEMTPELKAYVKDQIRQQITTDVANTKEAWIKLGLWQNDKLAMPLGEGYRNKIGKSAAMEHLITDAQKNELGLSGEKLEAALTEAYNASDRGVSNHMLYDYAINYHLHNIEMQMLFLGDPADFLKNEKAKLSNNPDIFQSSDVNTWKSYIDKIRDNLSKRMAGVQAAGMVGNVGKNQTANTVVLVDNAVTSKMIAEYRTALGEDAKKYESIDHMDGQEIITAEEDLLMKFQYGKIGRVKYEALLAKVKGAHEDTKAGIVYTHEYTKKDGTKSVIRSVIQEKHMFTDDENFIAQAQKPVVYAMIPVDLGPNQIKFKTTYYKPSAFGLYPQFTAGMEIDKIREAAYELNKKGTRVDRFVTKSAAKLGAKGAIKGVFTQSPDGRVNINIAPLMAVTSASIDMVPREQLRIQLEVPYDPDKDKIRIASQQVKLIFNEILDMDFDGALVATFLPEFKGKSVKGSELKALHEETFKKLLTVSRDEVTAEIGATWDEANDTYSFDNLEKLQSVLYKQAIDQGYDLPSLEGLELTEDKKSFKIPLSFSNNADRYEKLLLSMVKKIILQKIHGRSFILATETGFVPKMAEKFVEGKEALDEKIAEAEQHGEQIIFSKNFDRKVGLLPARIDPNNPGAILPAQVIISFKFKDSKGNKLNLKDYIKDGLLDTSKFDPETLRMLGIRIPVQGHPSMASVEIVGFIPEFMGDLLIAPMDFTKQFGSDFDIDKLYAYTYNYKVNSDGRIERVRPKAKRTGEKDLDEEESLVDKMMIDSEEESLDKKILQNKLMDIYHVIMLNREVWAKSMQGITEGNLTNLADKIRESRLAGKSNAFFSPSSEQNKVEEYFENKAGKVGVGIYSVNNTFATVIEKRGLKLARLNADDEKVENPFVIIDNDGKAHDFAELSGHRGFNRIISAYQSGAVDNAKLKILDFINSNQNTMGISSLMAMLANDDLTHTVEGKPDQPIMSEDFIVYFLGQPAIVDYINSLGMGNDAISGYETQFEDKQLASALTAIEDKLTDMLGADFIIQANNFKGFNIDKLKSHLFSPNTDDPEYVLLQYAVLKKFAELKETSDDIRTLQYLLNADSNGTPGSLDEALYKRDRLASVLHVDEMTGEVKGVRTLLNAEKAFLNDDGSTTLQGEQAMMGIKLPVQLFGETGIFSSGSKAVEKMISIVRKINNKSPEVYSYKFGRKVDKAMLSFLQSDNRFEVQDADTTVFYEKQALLYGALGYSSLAEAIEEFKKTDEYKNSNILKPLFESLKIRPEVKRSFGKVEVVDGGAQFVEFQAFTGLINPVEEIIQSLEYLRTNNYPLFEKLVKYTLLIQFKNSPVSLRNFVAPYYLQGIGVAERYRTIADGLNTQSLEDLLEKRAAYGSVPMFVEQFLQHNPEEAFPVDLAHVKFITSDFQDSERNVPTNAFSIDTTAHREYEFFQVEEGAEISAVATPYVSFYDPETGSQRLYKVSSYQIPGETHRTVYTEIPTLGQYNLEEYEFDQNPAKNLQSVLASKRVEPFMTPVPQEPRPVIVTKKGKVLPTGPQSINELYALLENDNEGWGEDDIFDSLATQWGLDLDDKDDLDELVALLRDNAYKKYAAMIAEAAALAQGDFEAQGKALEIIKKLNKILDKDSLYKEYFDEEAKSPAREMSEVLEHLSDEYDRALEAAEKHVKRETLEQLLERVGAKKVSKGILQINGQHYYLDQDYWDIMGKPGRDELFIYPRGKDDNSSPEIYVGSRLDGRKDFKSELPSDAKPNTGTRVEKIIQWSAIKDLPVFPNDTEVNVMRKYDLAKGHEHEHFGNPYVGSVRHDKNGKKIDFVDKGMKVVPNIETARKAYIDWLDGKIDTDFNQKQRNWINEQIAAGVLDGKALLYYEPRGVENNDGTFIEGAYYSHANALADRVNRMRSVEPKSQDFPGENNTTEVPTGQKIAPVYDNSTGVAGNMIQTYFGVDTEGEGEDVVKGILETIAGDRNLDNPYFKELANLLLEVNKKTGFLKGISFVVSTKAVGGDFYQPDIHTISIQANHTAEELPYIALHEIIHAASQGGLSGSEAGKQLYLRIGQMIDQLSSDANLQAAIDFHGANETLEQVKHKLNLLRNDPQGIHSFNSEAEQKILAYLLDPHEFVAIVLGDRATQNFLNTVSYEDFPGATPQSFWRRFKDIFTLFLEKIARMLDIKIADKSALKAAIGLALESLEDTKSKDYLWYGKIYDIILDENGKGVDVIGYKGKNIDKLKIVDAFNANPNLDVQTGRIYRKDETPTTTVEEVVAPMEIVQDYTFTYKDITIDTGNIQLNEDQTKALELAIDAVGRRQTAFTIRGFAGTGKSTSIAFLVKYLKKKYPSGMDMKCAAPTHKAVKVLKAFFIRNKEYSTDEYTVAKILGLQKINGEFVPGKFEKMPSGGLLIVDEASMIDRKTYNQLMELAKSKRTTIIFMGDPAQIPPVSEPIVSQALLFKNDSEGVELTRLMRQKAGNPLIKLLTKIRENLLSKHDAFEHKGELNERGEGVNFTNSSKAFDSKLKDAFASDKFKVDKSAAKVIAYTNSAVFNYNQMVRDHILEDSRVAYQPGEILMGYEQTGAANTTIHNGQDYEIKSSKYQTKTVTIPVTKLEGKDWMTTNVAVPIDGFQVTLKEVYDPETTKTLRDYYANKMNLSEAEIDSLFTKKTFIINPASANNSKLFTHLYDWKQFLKSNVAWKYKEQAWREYDNFIAGHQMPDQLIKFAGEEVTTLTRLKSARPELFVRQVDGTIPLSKLQYQEFEKNVDYGYAITAHKSQGSTYATVFVDLDNLHNPANMKLVKEGSADFSYERNNLEYVAFSRSSNRVEAFSKDGQPAVHRYVGISPTQGVTNTPQNTTVHETLTADYWQTLKEAIHNERNSVYKAHTAGKLTDAERDARLLKISHKLKRVTDNQDALITGGFNLLDFYNNATRDLLEARRLLASSPKLSIEEYNQIATAVKYYNVLYNKLRADYDGDQAWVTHELMTKVTLNKKKADMIQTDLLELAMAAYVDEYNDKTGFDKVKTDLKNTGKSESYRNTFINVLQSKNALARSIGRVVADMISEIESSEKEHEEEDTKALNRFLPYFTFSDITTEDKFQDFTMQWKTHKDFINRYSGLYNRTKENIFEIADNIRQAKLKSQFIGQRLEEIAHTIDLRYLAADMYNEEARFFEDIDLDRLQANSRDIYIQHLEDLYNDQFDDYSPEYREDRIKSIIEYADKKIDEYKLLKQDEEARIASLTVTDKEKKDMLIDWIAYNSPFVVLNERFGLEQSKGSALNHARFPTARTSKLVTITSKKTGQTTTGRQFVDHKLRRSKTEHYISKKANRKIKGVHTGFYNEDFLKMEEAQFTRQREIAKLQAAGDQAAIDELNKVPTKWEFYKWATGRQAYYLAALPKFLREDVKFYSLLDIENTSRAGLERKLGGVKKLFTPSFAYFDNFMNNLKSFWFMPELANIAYDSLVQSVSERHRVQDSKRIDFIRNASKKNFNPGHLKDVLNKEGLGDLKTDSIKIYMETLRNMAVNYKVKSEAEAMIRLGEYLFDKTEQSDSGTKGLGLKSTESDSVRWVVDNKLYGSDRIKEYDSWLDSKSKMFGVAPSTWKLTKKERDRVNGIKYRIAYLTAYKKNTGIPLHEQAKIDFELNKLNESLEKIVRVVNRKTVNDAFAGFIRLGAIGYAVFGRVIDFFQSGFLGGMREAMDGRLYGMESYWKSLAYVTALYMPKTAGSVLAVGGTMMLNPVVAGAGLGLRVAAGAANQNLDAHKKLTEIMKKLGALDFYHTVSDDEVVTNSVKRSIAEEVIDPIKLLKPYQLTQEVEQINKSIPTLAVLFETEIEALDGSKHSLYDAFIVNQEGEVVWDEAKFGPQKDAGYDWVSGDKMRITKAKIRTAVANVSGDYANEHTLLADAQGRTRVLMMLRRYMAQWLQARISDTYEDDNTGLQYMGSMYSLAHQVNNLRKTGKFKKDEYIVAANLQALHGTLATLAIFSLGLATIAAAGGGDPDKKEGDDAYTLQMLHFMNNVLMRSLQDNVVLVDPTVLKKRSITGLHPYLSFMYNAISAGDAGLRYLQNDDIMDHRELSQNGLSMLVKMPHVNKKTGKIEYKTNPKLSQYPEVSRFKYKGTKLVPIFSQINSMPKKLRIIKQGNMSLWFSNTFLQDEEQ